MPRKTSLSNRLAAGKCPECGVRPRGEKRQRCDPCAERSSARQRKHYVELRESKMTRRERRLAVGMCPDCGVRPRGEKRQRCNPCAERVGAYQRELYDERRESKMTRRARRLAVGMCPECGVRPRGEKRQRCNPCAEREAAYKRELYDERRAAGRCTKCGGPSPRGYADCDDCQERSKGVKPEDRKPPASAREKVVVKLGPYHCRECEFSLKAVTERSGIEPVDGVCGYCQLEAKARKGIAEWTATKWADKD